MIKYTIICGFLGIISFCPPTDKETPDWTFTTQGERTYEEQLSIEPDYIYYDTTGMQREMDSIDNYMRYWYEVLDTNSNGDIDDTE